MPDTNRVTVRMYNVGFGDAFLVSVHRDGQTWRMLVDCGVHKNGQVHPIESVVETIIADLKAEAPQREPHLDVIVATHRHADHISGFARPEWQEVTVGEVWLSFVEDLDDPDARGLRDSHDATAKALLELIDMRTANLNPGATPREILLARSFALNSLTNQNALDRLLGANGSGFAQPHTVPFFPRHHAGGEPADTVAGRHRARAGSVPGPGTTQADGPTQECGLVAARHQRRRHGRARHRPPVHRRFPGAR
jgi:hypothetical protein